MRNTERNNGNWRRFKFEDEAKDRADEIDRLLYHFGCGSDFDLWDDLVDFPSAGGPRRPARRDDR